jgi:hypothetical protein
MIEATARTLVYYLSYGLVRGAESVLLPSQQSH